MAAVLCCGDGAVLSHLAAAALWGIRPSALVEVSVRADSARRHRGIKVHRRLALRVGEIAEHDGIPVTSPTCSIVDIASRVETAELERAINEADRLNLTTPEDLRVALRSMRGRRGVAILRAMLDRRTFRLTRSVLERRFIGLALAAGLGTPETGKQVNGFEVDFYWPDLGLVVETDGLRYHRTPAQQTRDRLRDQVHAAAGLTALRFTHAQVHYEPQHVNATLRAVARRLA
jgi:very-short-patch-repair endonuclease